MADHPNLPRAPVVINTKDDQRIKPACPICGALAWGVPSFSSDGEPAEPVMTAVVSSGQLYTVAIRQAVCGNCGFVWQRFDPPPPLVPAQ